MGATATSKLEQAKSLRRLSAELKKWAPEEAENLQTIARKKVRQAVKQLRPRKKSRRNLR